jgi:hypothetical protein
MHIIIYHDFILKLYGLFILGCSWYMFWLLCPLLYSAARRRSPPLGKTSLFILPENHIIIFLWNHCCLIKQLLESVWYRPSSFEALKLWLAWSLLLAIYLYTLKIYVWSRYMDFAAWLHLKEQSLSVWFIYFLGTFCLCWNWWMICCNRSTSSIWQ